MFPKEHGAYGQLTFPLVAAFAVAGVTWSSVLTALAAVAGFVAHEPLLVRVGRRGVRAKREDGARAMRWLLASAVVALAAGGAAVTLAPSESRWAFLVPVMPAVLVAVALALDREKSTAGEVLVATALSFVSIPVCVVAASAASTALAIGLAFATHFSATTLAVRVVILKVRGGGNPRATRTTRVLLFTLIIAAVGALSALAVGGVLPWTPLLAIAPGVITAINLAVNPPPATRLRTVGWTLVATSVAATAILVAGLR